MNGPTISTIFTQRFLENDCAIEASLGLRFDAISALGTELSHIVKYLSVALRTNNAHLGLVFQRPRSSLAPLATVVPFVVDHKIVDHHIFPGYIACGARKSTRARMRKLDSNKPVSTLMMDHLHEGAGSLFYKTHFEQD